MATGGVKPTALSRLMSVIDYFLDDRGSRRRKHYQDFLSELRNDVPVPQKREDSDLFAKLRAWRKTAADATGVPAYVVFHDATLREICESNPGSLDDLARVPGVGPTKLERYGPAVLEVLRQG